MRSFFAYPIFAITILILTGPEALAANDDEPKLAPPFSAKALDGSQVTLQSLKGKAVIINFWATWCVPCKIEIPLLDETYRNNKEKGLVILGANYLQPAPIIKKFISKNPISFPILLDEEGILSKKYAVFALPTTYFIDKKGIYLGSHTGLLTPEILEEYLTKMIAN